MTQRHTEKSTPTDEEKKFEELILCASEELRTKLKFYKDEETSNRKILKEFGLEKVLLTIPEDLFTSIDVTDVHSMLSAQNRKLDKLSNDLLIAQLEKYLNSFENMQNDIENYNTFFDRELQKYHTQYSKECQKSNQDLLDFTSLQTNIHELQASIHQANDQQEHKKAIINKLFECYEVHQKINQYLQDASKLREKMSEFRHLPPNLLEAEKRLNNLKKQYKEVSENFTRQLAEK